MAVEEVHIIRHAHDLSNWTSRRNSGAHCHECRQLSTDGRLTYPPDCPHPELGKGLPPVEPMRLPRSVCAIMAKKLLQQLLRAVAGNLGYICVDGADGAAGDKVLKRLPWFELGSSP